MPRVNTRWYRSALLPRMSMSPTPRSSGAPPISRCGPPSSRWTPAPVRAWHRAQAQPTPTLHPVGLGMTDRLVPTGRYACTATTVGLACVLCLLAIPARSSDASDASFQLRAGLEDLPRYFPGYLANGYLSTLTAPRGTEATRAYLVGFMDYAPGDMSRPAAIPAWTDIDFNPGAAGERHGWLNRAALNERRFSDYHQTLDLRAATLTTSYRFLDRGRTTAIEVTTLVSEATPHLAATQLKVTPDYDGTVQLSFGLLLWSEHAPRFPLAEISGPQMEEAVAAQGLTLARQPGTPATPRCARATVKPARCRCGSKARRKRDSAWRWPLLWRSRKS